MRLNIMGTMALAAQVKEMPRTPVKPINKPSVVDINAASEADIVSVGVEKATAKKIVEGAVGMVDMALTALAKNNIVQLDEERKAAMVSNLLVVLCSERSAQPVLNAGTEPTQSPAAGAEV